MAKQETAEEKQARETIETIATTIAQLSRQVKAIIGGRLNRDTIIILLANTTRLPQQTVMTVLTAIENMEAKHLK